MDRAGLIAYVRDRFGAEPEYLWEKFPDTFVFRHRANRKWFAVVMDVQRRKLGLTGEGAVFVLDVKCGPILAGSYAGAPGVIPAWHMNKSQWIGVLLDGSAPSGTIRELLEISYDLTRGKTL